MIDFKEKEQYTYTDLLQLVQFLRQPGGCPWDGAQDHQSIRRCFLEETAEACEAIDQADVVHLQEELGDVLYQVVFHADLEREAGRFTMEDVIDGICKKLVARHPFLFEPAAAPSDVTNSAALWEERKRQLNGQKTVAAQLHAVCRTLPGLWRAEKLCKKAAPYDPQTIESAAAELTAQHTQLHNALRSNADVSALLGFVLFTVAKLAVQLSLDPEVCLHDACEAYIQEISTREAAASPNGLHKEKRISL